VYLRWLVITPQPARFDILTASMLSVTDPIWLTYIVIRIHNSWVEKAIGNNKMKISQTRHTLRRRALHDFSSIAFATLCT
jgi:hypothetical protein